MTDKLYRAVLVVLFGLALGCVVAGAITALTVAMQTVSSQHHEALYTD